MADQNGETRRQRNERFDRSDLNPSAEDVPGGERLEDIFWQLSRFRGSGLNGPEPLQPGTVRDWCQLTGRPLSRQEIGVLFAMDGAYLGAAQREAEEAGEEN